MITIGATAGSGSPGASSPGGLFLGVFTLAGAAAGDVFKRVRIRIQNAVATPAGFRVVVYNSSDQLVDWAAAVLPASAPDQIVEVPLTGAVPVTNGSYKIGGQYSSSDQYQFRLTSGGTVNYTAGAVTYGAAPPTSPTLSSLTWLMRVEADVEAGAAAFVPRTVVYS